jgi:hypothetical protein
MKVRRFVISEMEYQNQVDFDRLNNDLRGSTNVATQVSQNGVYVFVYAFYPDDEQEKSCQEDRQVFCGDCAHYNEDTGCWHPLNVVFKRSYAEQWTERESPSVINKNHDCPWWEGK